jgi:UDP-N-acetylglucosamine diphosphorylase / glucose-1-phosphate thymidylyltransferase / UDP-N-acetylgalactosamine diphosphorylase / glucosamine-1-phosphate N-acetyltransferase / galactosamine-1-phosphate N-acetyltransferase
MILLDDLIDGFSKQFGMQMYQPWELVHNIAAIITQKISSLDIGYQIENGNAIHHTAVIEHNVTIKSPVIIGPNCFVGANAYLRGGVWLMDGVRIGTGCEIKSSVIFNNSAIAHFNFIGDSIIGSYVNFEAGSITANHYNERNDKQISIKYNEQIIETDTTKFGALVGDQSTIGANAVLSPGTILHRGVNVRRLELIEQIKF